MLRYNFTAAEYAAQEQISVSTAKRRLQQLVIDGAVKVRLSWEDNPKASDRISYGTNFPPIKINRYSFTGD